jgi:hypothetical protein
MEYESDESKQTPTQQVGHERDVMHDVYHLLDDIEWCVDLTNETGKDVYACPVCGGRYLFGVGGKHKTGCLFNEVYKKVESIVIDA